tara:strand:- start:238 stop:1221 length:984 start_codon:yes stop_codon:yes gene_type:complete
MVTGGAGFIGSNIVRALNARGEDNIILVDDLSDGNKSKKSNNLSDLKISEYIDYKDLLTNLTNPSYDYLKNISCVFHQGACTDTTEWDGKYMMESNCLYSKTLLDWALAHQIHFIYASSASVYGTGNSFIEERRFESPINMYAYSKFLFDQYVRQKIQRHNRVTTNIIGLRYFNVYGFGESHKDHMTSPMHHFYHQFLDDGKIKLFKGSDGYEDGEQRRDYIYIDDVVRVNLWFFDNLMGQISGIYNTGTGVSETFNTIAENIIKYFGSGTIKYIDFPEKLIGSYQSYTQADISILRECGYVENFVDLKKGIKLYLDRLEEARENSS